MTQNHDAPIRIAAIVASTREGRFAPVITNWLLEQTRHRVDVDVDVIDLVGIDLPSNLGPAAARSIAPVRERLGLADAFVVITPEYNHSYPAAIKQLIDLVKIEWQAKPVSFVSYGGMSGGLRAVEHLRNVFAEVHAVAIRDVVSFHNPWSTFDIDAEGRGELRDPDRCNAAAKLMLDELAWFGRALRTARAEHPYGA